MHKYLKYYRKNAIKNVISHVVRACLSHCLVAECPEAGKAQVFDKRCKTSLTRELC